MAVGNKTLYEEFARFFENPSREGLRELLKDNVGELSNCDFKQQWPAFSKFAHHLLGLGNSDGGCIIIGVAQKEDKTLEPKGLETLKDKADVINGVKRFLPEPLLENVNVLDFAFEASEYPKIVGKKFQVVFVLDDPRHLPFVATSDGAGIRNNAIYVRRGTSTEEANYEELERIINRRLDTGYSSQREIDLQKHLEQLNVLFRQVQMGRFVQHIQVEGLVQSIKQSISQLPESIKKIMGVESKWVPDPIYPKEDFEAFIVRMIERKKKRIEIELDVVDL